MKFWLIGLSALLGVQVVDAQTFPAKAFKLVVPFAAGGSTDALARAIAPRLAEELGQPVIVENKPGAGTMIGTRSVMQMPPDGYTLLLSSTSFATAALAYRNPGYKMSDFTAVGNVGGNPLILSVNAALPIHNLADLVQYAKANPGKLNAVSLGSASMTSLAVERFKAAAGIQMTSINYGGSAPAMSALLAGVVDLFMDGSVTTLAQTSSPRLRMLGITTERRILAAPQLPTFVEQGFANMRVQNWSAIFVVKRTPTAAVERLRAAISRALADPAVKDQLATLGIEPSRGGAIEFEQFLAADLKLWAKDVERAGLQLD